MCRLSPVQKEWKHNDGDKEAYYCARDKRFISPFEYIWYSEIVDRIWLPRQEDWQEIVKIHVFANTLDRWISLNIVYLREHVIELVRGRGFTLADYWTILWCLFVHKEVYGSIWDWEEKKWITL